MARCHRSLLSSNTCSSTHPALGPARSRQRAVPKAASLSPTPREHFPRVIL